MNNIKRNPGDNIGGHRMFLFIPVEDVESIPDAVNMVVSEDIELKTDKAWYYGLFTQDTHGYVEPMEENEAGPYYKKKLTGFISTVTKEMTALIEDFESRLFVLISLDNNGNLRLIGSLNEPMRVSIDETSQDNAAGRSGYSVMFRRDSTFKSYFYEPETTINWNSYAAE